ncbi:MAG: deoxyguanosinetriphosphate triphosphohydrolase [Actinobacteria bacterium]|nr:MAG: deoxyguanosinetriphosphate triphosphohydrolase [Actinomycetota bacterium]
MKAFRLRTRDTAEALELEQLAHGATLSSRSRGRAVPEEQDQWRTVFERDRDRILHSKAFRRLKHKTQVFMNPEGDHFVTRMTHTLQVTQIGGAIARALSLNVALADAVCLGHDVGHSPFGHTGEDALSEFVDGEWRHSDQSVRIFEILEPLNLTSEVLEGIRTHPWKVTEQATTHEGSIVRFSDRIAYLAHDALDALRAGILDPSEFPEGVLQAFGSPGREWVQAMVQSVIDESYRQNEIAMEPHMLEAMHALRDFMFTNVYLRPSAETQRRRAQQIVRDLVTYYLEHPDAVPESYRHDDADDLTQVIDYVAGMTDRYAIRAHDELFRPTLF